MFKPRGPTVTGLHKLHVLSQGDDVSMVQLAVIMMQQYGIATDEYQ